MTAVTPDLDRLAIDTIRTLSIDGVQQANSGHPGAPMGAAPMAYVLWTRFLRHAPTHPDWADRDRFVLCAGHASMLLYSLLHLTGYDLSLDDLKPFRQWGSRTPGHPEYGLTPGVEATTGPLGQGLDERRRDGDRRASPRRGVQPRRARPRRPLDLRDRLRRRPPGRASRRRPAASPATSGSASSSSSTTTTTSSSTVRPRWPGRRTCSTRFEAYGWHTQRVEDGNDLAAIEAAIEAARGDDRPSLIAVRTHIGYGSPNKQDSQKAHGSPLGPDEVRLVKEAYGWDPDKTFYVPDDALAVFREAVPEGERLVAEWETRFDAYRDAFPEAAADFRRRMTRGGLREGWDADLKVYETGSEVATRNASQDAIQALATRVPELFGGAADLSESNLTDVKGEPNFEADEAGRNLRFGVREHAMGGIANGIAYHGGFIPYDATFLTFSDYMRGSVRLSALAGLHVIDVWTHDSVGLGEDGPTHQPVEHYAALRAIPNLWFVRPGDANETSAAWATRRGTRRRTGRAGADPPEAADPAGTDGAGTRRRPARRLRACARRAVATPELILIGTGSELQLAFAAAETLEGEGIQTRVVSLPCWERFDDAGRGLPRRGPAADPCASGSAWRSASSLGWERCVGDEGAIIGLDHFGASAPAGTIFEHFGFTADRVADVARKVVRDGPARPDPDGRRRPLRRHAPDARSRRPGRRAAPAARIPVTAEPGRATETVALDFDHGHHRRGSGPLARRGLRRAGRGRPGARRRSLTGHPLAARCGAGRREPAQARSRSSSRWRACSRPSIARRPSRGCTA